MTLSASPISNGGKRGEDLKSAKVLQGMKDTVSEFPTAKSAIIFGPLPPRIVGSFQKANSGPLNGPVLPVLYLEPITTLVISAR